MNCFVHIGKMVAALLACGILLLFCGAFAANGFWAVAVCCLLLGLVYATISVRNGALVHIDETSVLRRTLGIRGKTLVWDEIREVGVVGTKIIHNRNGRRTGTKYIYFSKREMTEEERFDMCLKWPPRDVIYIHYSLKKIHFVQKIWSGRIKLYNTGELAL